MELYLSFLHSISSLSFASVIHLLPIRDTILQLILTSSNTEAQNIIQHITVMYPATLHFQAFFMKWYHVQVMSFHLRPSRGPKILGIFSLNHYMECIHLRCLQILIFSHTDPHQTVSVV